MAPVRLGRRPALDGIRAVAVTSVFVQHVGTSWPAGFGVSLFFALSGFLITSLLLEEAAAEGHVNLVQFWARRALRLLPAIGVFLAAVAAFCLIVRSYPLSDVSLHGLPWALGYVANWRLAFGHPMGFFGPLWSLAVEEQFYLVWPLLIAVVATQVRGSSRETAVIAVSLAGVLAVFVQRVFVMKAGAYPLRLWGTDLCADELLVGCALAGVWRLMAVRRASWHPLVGWAALVVSVGFHVWLAHEIATGKMIFFGLGTIVYTGLALANGAVVAHVMLVDRGPVARLLGVRPLVAIGRRSYGMYLWHFPAIYLVAYYVSRSKVTFAALAAVITLVVAFLSYRFVELPFLRYKDHFRRDRGGVADETDDTTDAGARPSPAWVGMTPSGGLAG